MVNKVLKVQITDLNHEGFGVAKNDGLTIFIPGALPDEEVSCQIIKKEKTFARAKLIDLFKSSPNRIKAICPAFGKCGGCDLLHLNYQAQLDFKKKMVLETIKRIGKISVDVDEIIPAETPFYYRNKIQVPVNATQGKLQIGYYERKSHKIVPLNECYIQSQTMTDIILYIKQLFIKYEVKGYDEVNNSGSIRHIIVRENKNSQFMIIFVSFEAIIPNIDKITSDLVSKFNMIKSIFLNINSQTHNTILGSKSKLLYGLAYLEDELDSLKIQLSPYSFYQINHKQTLLLYKTIKDLLMPTKNDLIIDAYCGVGTISLYLARFVKKVYGIEVVKEAIIDANKNRHLNNINNVEFFEDFVEEVLPSILQKEKITKIIIDPPRKGLEQKVITAIKNALIPIVIYVSCDAASLARDLAIFSDIYEVKVLKCLDMFPQTTNVECVAYLKRRQ